MRAFFGRIIVSELKLQNLGRAKRGRSQSNRIPKLNVKKLQSLVKEVHQPISASIEALWLAPGTFPRW